MKKISKINESKPGMIVVAVCIFTIMFILNLMTDLIADDYQFLYSFKDGSRITSVWSIFQSLAVHYQIENGRLFAHFLVQLFLLLPAGFFKILNSAALVLEIYLIYRIANLKHRQNAFLFFVVFGLIWLFQPDFGSVYLWLTGSLNYLWCGVFNLLYLVFFVKKYLFNQDIKSKICRVLFVALGFLVGGYGENAALATLLMVVVFLALTAFHKHYKVGIYHIASILALCVSFYFMMSAPGTIKNKYSEFQLTILVKNFMVALNMLYRFRILFIAFCVLLLLSCLNNTDADKITVSVVCVFGALVSNFAMAFGSGYPGRSAFYCVILLVAGCVTLLFELLDTKHCELCLSLGVIVAAFTLYYGLIGSWDIYLTHAKIQYNTSVINECRENNIMDVTLEMVNPQTMYSPAYGMLYLNTEDPDSWPNHQMAEYFGVNSIIGQWP